MAQTAITYPGITVRTLTGAEIRDALEDVADNLFNPDPYYRQGGDMMRTRGLSYSCSPTGTTGRRTTNLRIKGALLEAGKRYRVASWGSVAQSGSNGAPVWEPIQEYLGRRKIIPIEPVNTPKLL